MENFPMSSDEFTLTDLHDTTKDYVKTVFPALKNYSDICIEIDSSLKFFGQKTIVVKEVAFNKEAYVTTTEFMKLKWRHIGKAQIYESVVILVNDAHRPHKMVDVITHKLKEFSL